MLHLPLARSLLVLLLLSEQPNEAEGQRPARAILPHYAHIHSLAHKHSGKQHWKTKQGLSLARSLHVTAKCSRMPATPMEKTIPREKNTPDCSACVRARVHMYVLDSFPSLFCSAPRHSHIQKGFVRTHRSVRAKLEQTNKAQR